MKEPPEKHNPMLRQSELPEFLKSLREFNGAEYTRSAVRILLLTGVRTGELRFATRDQFDLDGGLWTIPPEGVKQLQKMIRGRMGQRFRLTWCHYRGRRSLRYAR